MDTTLNRMEKDLPCALTCKVLRVHNGGTAIVVTDGTPSTFSHYAVDGKVCHNPTEVTIFVDASCITANQKITIPKEGDFVYLKEVKW